MNRKTPVGLAVAATLFVSLCLVGSGSAVRKEISSTHRVVIDGRSFVTDDSLPEDTASSHPVFSVRLKDSTRPADVEDPRLPAGWTSEHTLRMEGDGAPVDLVFGKAGSPGPSVRYRLLSSGWKSLSPEKDPGGTRVLQFLHGKETAIVCLDEAEGTFLLFREVGR